MLLTSKGKQIATIGGGALELKILDLGREAFERKNFSPQYLKLEHFKSGDHPSGLICGGTQTQVCSIFNPQEDLELVDRIVNEMDKTPGAALEFSKTGVKLIEASPSNPACTSWLSYAKEDWKAFIRLFNRRRVNIWGGGHCGVALAKQMRLLGYSVSLFEWRREIFTLHQFEYGKLIWVDNFAKCENHLVYPEITFAIIMTHDFPNDVQALKGILPHPFPFIGLMGSNRKIHAIRECLINEGVSKETLSRITAPVGLDFDSNTPEEIAVSISAQILIQRETLGLI